MFKPFKGLDYDEIQAVRKVYPILKRVQDATDVPWQAIAGIWFRESFSVANPKRPGGPFQFDPVPSPGALRGLLDRFTKLSDAEKHDLVLNGAHDFYSGAIFAACFLRLKTGPTIHPGVDDEVIKDAIYGYNGKAYHMAENSPYVFNGYDSAHYPMRLTGTMPDGKGGREKVSFLDEKPGAFVVYKQLKVLFA
jgi:hypothetical protein